MPPAVVVLGSLEFLVTAPVRCVLCFASECLDQPFLTETFEMGFGLESRELGACNFEMAPGPCECNIQHTLYIKMIICSLLYTNTFKRVFADFDGSSEGLMPALLL